MNNLGRLPLRRLRSWDRGSSAACCPKGAIVKLEDTPLRMFLPAQWHGHPKLVYVFGWRFDPELPFLASKISKGAVVFDIGANIGTWSLILSLATGPNGKIFAL